MAGPLRVPRITKLEQILRHVEVRPEKIADRKAYPWTIPALARLERLELHPHVTFLVGENGSGKSTLVEALAIKAGFNREGGTKSFTSRHRPSESSLHEALRMARGARRERSGFFLRAETMFNVATEAEDYRQYGWELLHDKSHGEAFLWTVANRFHDGGLYILDEPESALSPRRQLVLLAHIHRLVCGGAQFVVATHSPILMAYPHARILQLDAGGIRAVRYEDTEHFGVTSAFFADRAAALAGVVEDAEQMVAGKRAKRGAARDEDHEDHEDPDVAEDGER